MSENPYDRPSDPGQAPQRRAHRRRRPRACARDAERRRLHRRGAREPARRRRDDVDRDDAVQPEPARARRSTSSEGIRAAGGTPMEFNTIAVSDGVSMGTDGHARLARLARGDRRLDRARRARPSVRRPRLHRRLRQDDPRRGDGARAARPPGLVLYGGSIAPGRFRGRDVTIQDVFEAVGAHAAGTMSDAEVHELESVACPGAGACGGQFTANTMAIGARLPRRQPGRAERHPGDASRQGGGRRTRRASSR